MLHCGPENKYQHRLLDFSYLDLTTKNNTYMLFYRLDFLTNTFYSKHANISHLQTHFCTIPNKQINKYY